MWFLALLRQAFAAIDGVVAWLIENTYKLVLSIADVQIFDNQVISDLGQRIYALIGIIMLFKLAFSLITYILNPDDFSDKSKGFSKLITNVMIVLALLVSTPFVFEKAFELQKLLMANSTIERIIFGTKMDDESITKSEMGRFISYSVFTAFLSPNETYVGDKCNDVYSIDSVIDDCSSELNKGSKFTDTARTNFKYAIDTTDTSLLLNSDIVGAYDGDTFLFNYMYGISTICGLFASYVLVLFCFDIATRTVKLGFLQIIAPIPIISYVDPKSSKDGMFKKWLKSCMMTYVDLFMRLIVLFFGVYVISLVLQGNMTKISDPTQTVSFTNAPLTKVFIILGTLLFVKRLPKLIEEITGIKLDGFEFDIRKRLGGVPFLGKPLVSAGGFLGRTGSALGGFYAGKALGLAGKGAGAIGSGIDSLTGNRISKAYGDVKNWSNASSSDFRNRFPKLSSELSGISGDAQKTFYGMTGGMFGGSKKADAMDDKIKKLDTYSKFKDTLKSQANYDTTDIMKEPWLSSIAGANTDIYNAAGKGVKGLKQYYEDLQNAGASYEDISAARNAWEKAQEFAITNGNPEIDAIKAEAARFVRANRDVFNSSEYSANDKASYDEINKGYVASKNESINVKSGEEYQRAQAQKAAMPPKQSK